MTSRLQNGRDARWRMRVRQDNGLMAIAPVCISSRNSYPSVIDIGAAHIPPARRPARRNTVDCPQAPSLPTVNANIQSLRQQLDELVVDNDAPSADSPSERPRPGAGIVIRGNGK
jgi:hypothetical protein